MDKIKWNNIRAKGSFRFIVVNGGLGFGGTLFVLIFLVGSLIFGRRITTGDVIAGAVPCLIAGLIFGLSIWLINEMRYR